MKRSLLNLAQAAGGVFGQLKEGLFETDLDYRLVFVNLYGARLVGFDDVDSCIAARVDLSTLFVDPTDLARILDALQTDQHLDSYVCLMYDLRGEQKWIEATINCLDDDAGQRSGYWGVFRDLTLHREVAESRDRLHQELLLALTRLEESRNLIHSTNRELEARNRDLREFSAAVTHDLRAPIAALKGFADILKQDHAAALNERGHHLVARIAHNATQMDRIIRGIQELVLAGEETEPRIEVELGQVVRAVLDTREEDLASVGARVEVVEKLPRVFAHPTKIYQLVDNLLSNALKFLDGVSEPRIRMCVGSAADPNAFCVEDNGPGIEPAHRERIFEKFYRCDRARPGVGLGLTIVRRVVELYRGRVWVEESSMGGARFCFTLPEAVRPGSA